MIGRKSRRDEPNQAKPNAQQNLKIELVVYEHIVQRYL